MSDAKEQDLREQGFAFCGAITASLSHEITNVFATINELSGLLDDFFAASKQGTPLDPERLSGTTQRIGSQVERGRELVRRLNRFAHTVDEVDDTISVNESVEAMALLCRRFAKLRRVTMETSLPETSLKTKGCPFDLQHIIYRCIDILLHTSKEGDVLQINVEPREDTARLIFSGHSPVESVAELQPRQDFLLVLLDAFHCTLESTLQAGQAVRLAVSLPRSLNGEGTRHE